MDERPVSVRSRENEIGEEELDNASGGVTRLRKETIILMKGKTMNEEIKKNEISEEQLEAVSGGAEDGSGMGGCPICGHGTTLHEELYNGWTRSYRYCNVCKKEVVNEMYY